MIDKPALGGQPARQLRVLQLIRELGECSRVEIAEALGLDRGTVSILVDNLLGAALVVPAGYRDSRSGRRQELLRINGAHSHYIGIDLGATHILGCRVDLNGRLLERIFFEIRPGLPVELILGQMKSIARSLLAAERATGEVRSAGIGVPGFVNPATGVSLIAENIAGWKEIRLREIFEELLGCPVYVDDCSRAFGRAEKWLGQGRRTSDFLVLDVGYGIGMAVFAGGELYPGSGYKSGEIGHLVVDPDGLECSCGKRGCLETVASGKAIARLAARGIRENRSGLLSGLTQGNADSVTAQDVAIAARMGDGFSTGLLSQAGARLGAALSHVANILNPSLVVIGGGLAGSGRLLLDSLEAELRRHTMMGIIDDLRLTVSKLGEDAPALGGALLAMEHLFSVAAPR